MLRVQLHAAQTLTATQLQSERESMAKVIAQMQGFAAQLEAQQESIKEHREAHARLLTALEVCTKCDCSCYVIYDRVSTYSLPSRVHAFVLRDAFDGRVSWHC